MKSVFAVGLGILMMLASLELLASKDETSEQSDDRQPVEQTENEDEDETQEQSDADQSIEQTKSEDTDTFPPLEEPGDLSLPRSFQRSRGWGSRRDNMPMSFGLRRGAMSVPLRVSLQLGGYFGNDLRYLSGSTSISSVLKKGKYSWQNSASYQIDWSQQQYGFSSRGWGEQQFGGSSQDWSRQQFEVPSRLEPRPGGDQLPYSPSTGEMPPTSELSSSDLQSTHDGSQGKGLLVHTRTSGRWRTQCRRESPDYQGIGLETEFPLGLLE